MPTCEWPEKLKCTTEKLVLGTKSSIDILLKYFPSYTWKEDKVSTGHNLVISIMELILKTVQRGCSHLLVLSFLQQKSSRFQFLYSFCTNKIEYLSHDCFPASVVYISNKAFVLRRQWKWATERKTEKSLSSKELSELVL